MTSILTAQIETRGTEQGPRPGVSRLERRKARTRDLILDSALELFERHGFDATSIADISTRADVGIGTVYGYYPSKDDLLVAVLSELSKDLGRRLLFAATVGMSWLDRLSASLQTQADFIRSHARIILAMYELNARRPGVLLQFSGLVTYYADLLRDGIARRECRPLPVDTTARALVSLHSLSALEIGVWCNGSDRSSLEADLKEFVGALLDVRI